MASQKHAQAQAAHKCYARPVFFVTDITRAVEFYTHGVGFEKAWHDGDGERKGCCSAVNVRCFSATTRAGVIEDDPRMRHVPALLRHRPQLRTEQGVVVGVRRDLGCGPRRQRTTLSASMSVGSR